MKLGFFGALALAMALGGCRSFMHLSDPSADDFLGRLCLGKAEDARAALEEESQRTGVSFAELLTAFQAACLFRASQGVNDGMRAGLDGARSAGAVAGCNKLTPANAEPQLKDPLEYRK